VTGNVVSIEAVHARRALTALLAACLNTPDDDATTHAAHLPHPCPACRTTTTGGVYCPTCVEELF
jgi:hypothetical protein